MASAAEALGMTVPGSSSFPAEYEEKLDECNSMGQVMRNLLEKNILPRDIMTRSAFENAMVRAHVPDPCRGFSHYHFLLGFDDHPGRLYERRPALDRHRAFGGDQIGHRRLPESVGQDPLHRRPQAQRQVCHGGRLQDRWHPQ